MMLLQDIGALRPLLVYLPIMVIFYVLLVLPQRREQKRHREMVAALQRGDQVVTLGGLVGEILAVKDDRITLKTGEAKVVVERSKVARRLTDPAAAA